MLQFWGGMFGLVVYWIVMVIFEFSKPTYLILALMALFFVLMNLLGYYRCRSWSTQELRLQQAGAGAFGGMVSGFTQGVASNFMVQSPPFTAVGFVVSALFLHLVVYCAWRDERACARVSTGRCAPAHWG